MKLIATTICAAVLMSTSLQAQTIQHRDPKISKLVEAISSDSIYQKIDRLTQFHTRHNMSHDNKKGHGLWESARWAEDYFKSLIPSSEGRLSVELLTFEAGGKGQRIPTEVELPVVMATLKGIDPSDDRVIIVSAHIDSRAYDNTDGEIYAPGANDDGSGVAAIMEMARLMSPQKWSGTIKFLLVGGEEHGLLGARFIAEKAKKENWNIIAMLNNDMIGNAQASETNTTENTKVRVFSQGIPMVETQEERRDRVLFGSENDSKTRQLARYFEEIGERYVDNLDIVMIYRNDRFGRGGDHTPFVQMGFNAVRICEFNENYYRTHQVVEERDGIKYGDVISGVDIEYVRKNGGANLAVMANLALAPKAPQNVILKTSGLSNKIFLTWKEPVGGVKPTGYYILIRPTHESQWEKKIWVEGLSAELPYSKDNYHFAVQSVSEGHESIAIYPRSK